MPFAVSSDVVSIFHHLRGFTSLIKIDASRCFVGRVRLEKRSSPNAFNRGDKRTRTAVRLIGKHIPLTVPIFVCSRIDPGSQS